MEYNGRTRLLELDALRGLAAILVVFYHLLFEYPKRYGKEVYEYFQFGHYGVELFFMISGYVIYMSIQHGSRKHFIISRVARLYPAYWVAVLTTFTIVNIIPIGLDKNIFELIVNLTMFQAFISVNHVDGSYWTLSYELVFYFYIFMFFINKRYVYFKAMFFLLVQTFYTFLMHVDVVVIRAIETLLIVQYINLFMLGLVFYLYSAKAASWKALLLFISISLINQYLLYGLESAVIISIFSVVFFLIINGKMSFLNNKVLTYLGTISYPLYLIHQYAGYAFLELFTSYGFGMLYSVFFVILLAIAWSHFVSFYVEKTFGSRIKRLGMLYFVYSKKTIRGS